MSIADELRKLGELHRGGALTDEEFAQAKARVLADQGGDAAAPDDTLREHLSELKRENELARLDREWDMERERYYMSARNSGRYLPTKASGIFIGVVAVFIGGCWTVMAAGMAGGQDGRASVYPLIGMVFVLIGVAIGVFTFFRAKQLERASQRYQHRRAMILSGDDDDAGESTPTRRAAVASSTNIQDRSEPATCVSCGKTIPADKDRCPHCGWSQT